MRKDVTIVNNFKVDGKKFKSADVRAMVYAAIDDVLFDSPGPIEFRFVVYPKGRSRIRVNYSGGDRRYVTLQIPKSFIDRDPTEVSGFVGACLLWGCWRVKGKNPTSDFAWGKAFKLGVEGPKGGDHKKNLIEERSQTANEKLQKLQVRMEDEKKRHKRTVKRIQKQITKAKRSVAYYKRSAIKKKEEVDFLDRLKDKVEQGTNLQKGD